MIYDYEYFKKEIYSLTTIDLNAYKEKQMKRRIDTLIAKHKIVGYDKYVQATRGGVLDFDNATTNDIEMFYDIGVAWLFLNSFKPKQKNG